MIKIISSDNIEKVHTDIYTPVSELIRNSNFSMPCGGKGSCLKCKVILKGDVSGLSQLEKSALSHKEIENGVRLACQAEIKSGEIILGKNFISHGITDGILLKPLAKKIKEDYAVAVDIGTTTIAAYLYDVNENKLINKLSEGNVLAPYGMDVMSRIEYAVKNSVSDMSRALSEQIERIIDSLLKNKTARVVVTGNTVMLNIYAGNPVGSMGVYPYTPESLFGEDRNILGRDVYIPKCISAFLGADLACAIISSEICKNKKAMLIDIGTNGEIALKNKDEIICTSVAAGPAFEGAGIKMGAGAIEGAVSKVFAQGTNLKYKTIENREPIGICGTGIIDFIAVLKRYGALTTNGALKKSGHPFTHLIEEKDSEVRVYLSGSNIYITEDDIRSVMLAKSAVISGMKALKESENISFDEMEALYIAGGFGNYLDINNSVEIGLIPDELKDKVIYIGNGAGMGALNICIDPEAEKDTGNYKNLSLSESLIFSEEFIKNLSL